MYSNIIGTVRIITILAFCLYIFGSSQAQNVSEITRVLDTLFNNYDGRIRPSYGRFVDVIQIDAFILDLFNINEQSHEFSVTMYFRQHWSDPRLTYKPPLDTKHIMLDASHAKKIWAPDTIFSNERTSHYHSTGELAETLRIKPDGEVLKSQRITMTAACKMKLSYYPFDSQLCTLEIESYRFSAKHFIYAWKHGQSSIGISKEASSLKYTIDGYYLREGSVESGGSNYSRLAIEFFLVRNYVRELQDKYFPAFTLTILAMLTLVIGGSLLVRSQFSFMLLTTMVIFMGLNTSILPQVSYQTVLDFYVFGCFCTIVWVVIVNVLMQYFYKPMIPSPIQIPVPPPTSQALPNQRNQRGAQPHKLEWSQSGSTGAGNYYGSGGGGIVGETLSGPIINNKFEAVLHKLVQSSKFAIPIGFIFFNVVYWIVVIIGSNVFPQDFLIFEVRE